MPCFTLRVPCLGREESCGGFQSRFLFLSHSFLQIMVVFFFDIVPLKAQWTSFVRPTKQQSRWSSLLVHLVASRLYVSILLALVFLSDWYCSNTPACIPWYNVQLFLYFTFFFLLTRTSTDWGTADNEEFPKNREGRYFTVKIKSELVFWSFVKDHCSKSPPVSHLNQILVTFEFSPSSSAWLCHRPYAKTFPLPHP